MTPRNYDLMGEAGEQLIGRELRTEVEWNNEVSGNSGTVILLNKDSLDEMPCQYHGRTVWAKNTKKEHKLVFRRCKKGTRGLHAPKN